MTKPEEMQELSVYAKLSERLANNLELLTLEARAIPLQARASRKNWANEIAKNLPWWKT